MDKINNIKQKYNERLTQLMKKYSFNKTTDQKFKELNHLFIDTLNKDINGISTVIEKRNELDFLQGISTMISGEYTKLKGKELEDAYLVLFANRDRLIDIVKKYNINNISKSLLSIPKKIVSNPVVIQKPDYGYHKKNPKYPLLEDNNEYF